MALQTYNHTQSVSSTTWTIVHNLNVASVVTDAMVNSGGVLKAMPGTVTHTDDNTLTITFPTSETGFARIVG